MDSIIAEGPFLQRLLQIMLIDYHFEGHREDALTIQKRYDSEGISFLTTTLPVLSRALLDGLDSGHFFCPLQFRRHRLSVLPVFLYGAFSQIFEDSGILKRDASVWAVAAVLQLCSFCYKLEQPFTDYQLRRAEEKFKETDLLGTCTTYSPSEAKSVRDELSWLLHDFSESYTSFQHGPGITADGRSPLSKWSVEKTYYASLDRVVPMSWAFGFEPSFTSHQISGVNKVLFVPKDSRGPRTIACEPHEYMWYQQAMARSLMLHVRNFPYINFLDQSINNRLAQLGSIDRSWNTLDLKDASDRVSLRLVKDIFPPRIARHLESFRTGYSRLPSGELVHLNKYAAMGSALCFPVESFVFWAIARSYHKTIEPGISYVYGDDIITTATDRAGFTEYIRKFGLEVNPSKSYFSGHFRESCGGDYFNGIDVTPIKVRKINRLSVIALANHLFNKGLVQAADFVKSTFRAPSAKNDYCYNFGPRSGVFRFNKDLQVLEVKTRGPLTKTRKLDDDWAYFRWLSQRRDDVFIASDVGFRSDAQSTRFYRVVE